jgi:hypothetical protein
MMAGGLLIMLVVGLIVVGLPVLIAVLIAGSGLATMFKSQTRQAEPDRTPSFHETAGERKCPSCGRAVQPGWNVCPSCGAALT